MKILKKRQILLLHSVLIAESGGSDGVLKLDAIKNQPVEYHALTTQYFYRLKIIKLKSSVSSVP